MVLNFTRRTASQEGPILTEPLRKVLSGSIEGATDADVQRAAVKANPMRMLVRLLCHRCAYEWQAPAMGACPQCHQIKWVERVDAIPCMAARI